MKQLSNRPAHGPSCHTADKLGPNAGMDVVNRLPTKAKHTDVYLEAENGSMFVNNVIREGRLG